MKKYCVLLAVLMGFIPTLSSAYNVLITNNTQSSITVRGLVSATSGGGASGPQTVSPNQSKVMFALPDTNYAFQVNIIISDSAGGWCQVIYEACGTSGGSANCNSAQVQEGRSMTCTAPKNWNGSYWTFYNGSTYAQPLIIVN